MGHSCTPGVCFVLIGNSLFTKAVILSHTLSNDTLDHLGIRLSPRVPFLLPMVSFFLPRVSFFYLWYHFFYQGYHCFYLWYHYIIFLLPWDSNLSCHPWCDMVPL